MNDLIQSEPFSLKRMVMRLKLLLMKGEALVMQVTLADDTENEMLKVANILKWHSIPANK
jgi:hypothetical protein